jgi:hypothetical protein
MAKARKAPPGLDRLRRSSAASAQAADFAAARLTPPLQAVPAPAPEQEPHEDRAAPEPAETPPPPPAGAKATAPTTVPEPPGDAPAAAPVGELDTTAAVETPTRVPDAEEARAATPQPVEPASKPRRTRPARRRLTPEAARKEVEASFLSAKRDPKAWEPAPIRLRDDLKARLDVRLATDQETTGNYRLALAHYLNAALRLVPDDVDRVVEMAEEHLDSLGTTPLRTTGSGTRLHRDVAARMRKLPAQLRRVSRHGLLVHVQCAAVEQLLDALDAGDETP